MAVSTPKTRSTLVNNAVTGNLCAITLKEVNFFIKERRWVWISCFSDGENRGPESYQWNYFKWKPASSDGAGEKYPPVVMYSPTISPLPACLVWGACPPSSAQSLVFLFPWNLGFHSRESIHLPHNLLITLAQKTLRGFWLLSPDILTPWYVFPYQDLETKESSEIDGELQGPYRDPCAQGKTLNLFHYIHTSFKMSPKWGKASSTSL